MTGLFNKRFMMTKVNSKEEAPSPRLERDREKIIVRPNRGFNAFTAVAV